MIILSGHSLTPSAFVPDEALSLTLKERESTAQWTPEDASGINVSSWVQGRGGPGDGIVWRVQSIQQAYATHTPTVSLEHIINILEDQILFGEITPKEITGNSGATTCTARQAVNYILSRQSDWTLGDFDFDSVSNPYKFNGDSLLDALKKVSDSLEGAWWSYDLTSYPFTLNITQKPAGVGSEMRANRNLASVTKTIDRSGMYTRFYPIGKDNLHIDGDYVSKNEALYGVISKVEVDQSISSKAELIRWANERLAKHAEPIVSIQADGLELSQATGEPLDKMTLGRICRLPLPEFNTTIEERIVEIHYPDAVFDPETIKITMANQQEDLTRIVADAIKRGGGGGRAAAVQQEIDHAWFEDTTEHVALIADNFEGLSASLVATASQIRAEVADDVNELNSTITQTASQIRSEVNASVSGLQSSITQTASQIRSEVSNSVNGLSSSIAQTASQIRSEVSSSISSAYSSIIEQTENTIRSEIQSASSGLVGSVIEQTESYIREQVGLKNKVYPQLDDPSLNPENELHEGDVWVEGIFTETWAQMGEKTWVEASQFDWQQYYGSVQKVWHNGQWEEFSNSIVEALNTQGLEITEKEIRLAKADIEGNRAEFLVTSSMIRAQIKDTENGLTSSITQTASQIRAEVSDATDTATIVAGINAQTGSYVKIAARNINLSGYVTADELSATNAKIRNLEADNATFSNLLTGQEQAGYIRVATLRAGAITFGSYSLRRGYITVDGTQFQVVMWGS